MKQLIGIIMAVFAIGAFLTKTKVSPRLCRGDSQRFVRALQY